jgi:hypothetical protein
VLPRIARLRKWTRVARLVADAAWPAGVWLRHRGRGALVQVENTSYCNVKCSYCVTHSPSSLMPLRRGHMDRATYERILDANPRARIVVLQGDGEPLLDPTVFDKIRVARERGLHTHIVSNGSQLARAGVIDRLLEAGPDVYLVSLDAVGREANETNRRGLDYAAVTAGLAELCRRRERLPRLIGLLSVVHGRYSAETEHALRDFDRIGIDILFYKQLNRAFEGRIANYQGGEAEPVPAALRRTLSYPISHQRISPIRPCPQLRFELPYYLWDGQETACCILNHERYAAPEYAHGSLLARWRRGAMPPECESCSYFAGYPAGVRPQGKLVQLRVRP